MITETAASALSQAETLVPSWLPGGKRKGREFVAASVRGGDGDSMSVNLETGMWSDFATGEKGGDLVSLYAAQHGIGQLEAAKAVAAMIGRAPSTQTSKPASKPTWTPCPGEGGLSMPQTIGRTWTYRSEDGTPLLVVERIDSPEGKTIRPWCWCKSESGIGAWRQKQIPKDRPLYGLPELLANPDWPVLVVEGEKSADAARSMFPTWCVTTWPSGAQSVDKADWSPLQGRLVVVWPDADEPGATAAGSVKRRVPGSAIVELPANLPKGWDLADATPEQHGDCIRRAQEALAKAVVTDDEPVPEFHDPESPPFKILGHDGDSFFAIVPDMAEVIRFSADGLSGNTLLRLASIDYWEANFPGKKGVDWNRAKNTVIRAGASCFFRAEWVRGRGAWDDNGRVVLHVGDRLIVDGKPESLRQFPSRYFYQESEPWSLSETQASPAECQALLDACLAIDLGDDGMNGRLLAGWCALASIGGAFRWRTHLWLTGQTSAGKSWVQENIVNQMLGMFCLKIQGATSEAGLRQSVNGESLPILFDEAEGKEKKSAERIAELLEYARACSFEGAGGIRKGTSGGTAQVFYPRNMICFASVNSGVANDTDRRRVAIMEVKSVKGERWERLKQAVLKLTPEIASRIRARMAMMIPTIRKNLEVFSNAITEQTGRRQDGDKYGMLLAGAYALCKSGVASPDEIAGWLRGQNFAEKIESPEDDKEDCLSWLLQSTAQHKGDHTSIAELIQSNDESLGAYGLSLGNGVLHISASPDVVRIYENSRWRGRQFIQVLKRFGLTPKDNRRCINGIQARCVTVPISFEV